MRLYILMLRFYFAECVILLHIGLMIAVVSYHSSDAAEHVAKKPSSSGIQRCQTE